MKRILISSILLWSTLTQAGLPPTTLSGQADATKATTFNFKTPNKQTTTIAGAGLIETGSTNEFSNSEFEGTDATMWTRGTGNSPSYNTSTPLSGLQSLNISISGNALNVSQLSYLNAGGQLGVQKTCSVYVNSSTISDIQLCSMVNGSSDKCTAVGGYTAGSGKRQLQVSFLGGASSNGCLLKSTDTSGSVDIDSFKMGDGAPIVNFLNDNVYSASVSSAGVVSGENVEFISGNATGSGDYTVNFTAGVFAVTPHCWAQTGPTASNYQDVQVYNTATSGTVARVFITNTGAATAGAFTLFCQKTGADYKSSSAYVASAASTLANTTTFTAKISPTGVKSNENVEGWLATGPFTPITTSYYTINFTSGLFTVPPVCNITTVTTGFYQPIISIDETVNSVQIYTGSSSGANAQGFNISCTRSSTDYTAAFNPVIVGTFDFTAPTVQRFTSGSGTYTLPFGVKYITVEMVGGGGGGAGSGTASQGSGGTGGTTTFGTSLLTATGGIAGTGSGGSPAGGSATVNSPAIAIRSSQGSNGGGTGVTVVTGTYMLGPSGGSSPFMGAGQGQGGGAGSSALVNSGSGGAAGGTNGTTNMQTGGSGASGAYIEALITSPAATYSYAVGAAGTAGAAGTSGYVGGAGGSGIIIVTEYYR